MKSQTKETKETKEHHGIKYWLKEIGTILGIFLVLNSFVIASFEVPTGSMENEIMGGDFLLVNKFVFGGTTPRTIPFTNVKLPYFKIPALWKVERGDVIVFAFPGYRDEVEPDIFAYYLKRAVAIAGDTIEIKNRILYVNGKPAPIPRNINYNSGIVKNHGYGDPRIFPNGAPFNEDNYGPIRVPKKGDIIDLSYNNYYWWDTFIKREGHTIDYINGKVIIDNNEETSYTIKHDYVFGMGDNRDNSLDSRFWGFIPEHDVIGTPLIVYWSWSPNLSIINLGEKIKSLRFNRIGKLIK